MTPDYYSSSNPNKYLEQHAPPKEQQPYAGADSVTNNKQPLGIPIGVMQAPKLRHRPLDNLQVIDTLIGRLNKS